MTVVGKPSQQSLDGDSSVVRLNTTLDEKINNHEEDVPIMEEVDKEDSDYMGSSSSDGDDIPDEKEDEPSLNESRILDEKT